jgi:hypothetical protein
MMQFGKGTESSKPATPGKELRKILLFTFAVVAIVAVLWLTSGKVLEQYQEKTDQATPAATQGSGPKVLPPGSDPSATPEVPESSPTTRDHGALKNVEDYKGIQQDYAYNYILRKVNQMSQAEIKFAAKNNYHLAAGNLLAKPDEYRGEFVKARGTIVHIDTLKLNTNPVGVEDVYEVYLVELNRDSTDGYYAHVIERPKMPRLGVDQGQVEGVFFKIYKYETRAGKAQFVPFIFGKRLVIEEAPKYERTTSDIEYFIVGLIALSFGTVLVISFVTRKGDKMMTDAISKVRLGHVQKKPDQPGLAPSPGARGATPAEGQKELPPDMPRPSAGEETGKALPPDRPA